MTEKIPSSGIYEWRSSDTIGQLASGRSAKLGKGVYLVRVLASFRSGPTGRYMTLFHINPPVEDTSPPGITSGQQNEATYMIVLAMLTAVLAAGLMISRRKVIHELRLQRTRDQVS